ncbi:P-loop containing nucleoside triphosphate hydrolase protein [Polychytrium aggregatum]|uniref:P-loop containing nucleoside triphosphate hydrolase protein n=1 Tax=Polychytrium aggregatum TaxID=110093 RepID=UPI0022FED9B5|nr:P-loop containing nucleoside triphosphate hydrolase protein [Polychytrium aggregatum]KAI9208347.1 P-loop containing nucleoside triphosphate hydrolase protein [Polychytrium aggregatum]
MTEVDSFADTLIKLVQEEKQCEIEEVAFLNSKFPATLLQRYGLALLNLRVSGLRTGLGGKCIVDFEPVQGGECRLPPHKFRPGDIVGVGQQASKQSTKSSSQKGDKEQPDINASGIVYKVQDQRITLAFTDDFDVEFDKFRILKLANNITYERMTEAMKYLKRCYGSGSQSVPLVRVLLGLQKPEFRSQVERCEFLDENLNDSQKEAIQFAISAEHVALIHGPPGTGKTMTCVEIIRQLVQRGERILVCGPSNIAVDNLVERLAKCRVDLVRIGHPARILPTVMEHALEIRIKTSDEGRIVNDVRSDMDKAFSSIQKARNRQERHALYQEVKALRSELRQREQVVVTTTIRNAKVVLSTLNGAAGKNLLHEEFDTVLIDEATQALEPECWIAIMKAKRVILAGDHLQLPPTVKSQKKKDGKKTSKPGKPYVPTSLETTLFDRMLDLYGDTVKRMLTVQYRMHEAIMGFSSKELYKSKLVADPSVKERLLMDLDDVAETDETSVPLVFIDTAGCALFERVDGGSDTGEGSNGGGPGKLPDLSGDSKFNEGEAQLVVKHVEGLVRAGVPDTEIAVISPYNAQVSYLKTLLSEAYPGMEIGSVDGFQGREKEAVVISLVRSNDQREVGFLSEPRRLNVALTRPKRHLCVVGDSETLSINPFLKRMVAYLEEIAEVRVPEMYE